MTTSATYSDTSSILTNATGFMGEYDYTLNPYSGCGFGCTYCYAAFFTRDQAKQDSWGDWVTVKQNAVEILERPKQQAKLNGAHIYMSSVTDAYQPIEKELKLTRRLLEIMAYGEGGKQTSMFSEPKGFTPKLVVQTRSPLVTRDIDLFQQIEANGGRVQVNMTVTTDNEDVRKQFEPQCPANQRRAEAIKEIHEAGIQSCITMTPLIWIDDPFVFADALLDTGIGRFIVQPFRFTGSGKFVAQTRDGAMELIAQLLGCQPSIGTIEQQYSRRYQEAVAVLRAMLPQLGEERDGFAPPF